MVQTAETDTALAYPIGGEMISLLEELRAIQATSNSASPLPKTISEVQLGTRSLP